MAMAVQKLFPKAQVTIGPWIENGFYYDFDHREPFTEKDLQAIEKEMIKIVNRKLPVIREEVSREEAQRRIAEINEPYKLEILAGLEDPISIYHLGDQWWDLCAGPHLENTREIDPKTIDLESVAGAYWRGDATKAQLQRIYGTAWEAPEQLTEYKRRKEEALKRDHRKLGKELGLFLFSDRVGPGLPTPTLKSPTLKSGATRTKPACAGFLSLPNSGLITRLYLFLSAAFPHAFSQLCNQLSNLVFYLLTQLVASKGCCFMGKNRNVRY